MRKLLLLAAACACLEAAAQSGYEMEPVVRPGSPFHGVHGLRFDAQGTLYAVSVLGQSVFTVDVETGTIERLVGPPQGMGDDIAIAADGTLVWTAIEDGVVYTRAPDGTVERLWDDVKGVNAVAFSPDRERLFVTLVFYGDALYELDLGREQPPRLVAENLGGLNAFEISAEDGMIYGPLVFGGRIVRVDPDTGAVETLTDDVVRPGALKLTGDGSAYVLDETEDGSVLLRLDLASAEIERVTRLPYGADNVALNPQGRVFVTLSEVNAIVEVFPRTGEIRYVTGPTPLTSPAGFAVVREGGRDRLYVGDAIGGFRVVDAASGQVTHAPVELFQPAHVDVAGDALLAVSEVFGTVQRLDRASFEVRDEWTGFERPADVLARANGNVVVADKWAGQVVEITGPGAEARRVVASGLAAPTGLAWAGQDAVYVSEADAGRIVRIGLDGASRRVVAAGLAQPEGIAVDAAGRLVVAEVEGGRITRVDPATGATTVIRADAPIGLSDGPSLYRAVETSGETIYFTSDIANTIYGLTPR